MILLDSPLSRVYRDPFDAALGLGWDGVLSAGASRTVTGGVLRLAVPAGAVDTVRTASAWRTGRATVQTVTARISSVTFAAITSRHQFAGVVVAVDANNADMAGRAVVGGVEKFALVKWRAGVMTVVHSADAIDGVTVRLERNGSNVTAVWIDPATGAATSMAVSADFPAGPSLPGMVVQTLEAGSATADFDDFETTGPVAITEASRLVVGCHLRCGLRIAGQDLPSGLAAAVCPRDFSTVDLATVTVDADGAAARIVLPSFDTPGERLLWFFENSQLAFADPLPLRWSDRGYRILRELVAPGRYTDDPGNVLNVVLAAFGAQIDQVDDARRSMMLRDIHPATCSAQLLHRWERIFGITPVAGEDVAVRRARVEARRLAAPRITLAQMQLLVDAVMDATILEFEDHDTYGDGAFCFVAPEPSPNFLDVRTHGELEQMLSASAPGYTRALVGHTAFIPGLSVPGRDILSGDPS